MNLVKKSLIVAVSSLFVGGLVACERESADTAAGPGESTTARSEPATPASPSTPPTGAGPTAEQRDSGAGGMAASPSTPGAQPSADAGEGDAAITAKVKSAFVAEPDLQALQIDVDTKDGTVTLTGEVDSEQKKERAAQIAQGQEGVKSVENRLTVKASG